MTQNFYLVLPNIRSCHNVGALFRTADACGVTKIFLVGYTPQPPRKEIDKVALGAETWVPWEHKRYLKSLVSRLKKEGVYVIGLEKNSQSVDIGNFTLPKERDIAFIVGNEVDGIRAEILKLCDVVTHIPMHGRKESLNVSVAAGIGMYVVSRQVLRSKEGRD